MIGQYGEETNRFKSTIATQAQGIQELKYMLEHDSSDPPALQIETEWTEEILHADNVDITLGVVAGSGCAEHIVPPSDIPGITVEPTRASMFGRGFVTATGESAE